MKMQVTKRLLALLLALSILAGFAVPVGAADGECVTLTQVDNSAVSATLPGNPVEEREQAPLYGADDMVRVSIVLERASTLDAGFSTHGISGNGEAMAYRTALREEQTAVAARIERTLGQELDVVWNLTLAANIISANVKYGQLASISRVAGVKKVVLETRYDPKEVTTETAEPTALVSAHMTGANQVWETGYTGGGTRIAVIDTGLDTDHQSFDANAFAYALTENAGLADMSYEDYLAKIDLLDGEEIAEKLSQLHVAERNPELTAEDLYVNLKAPFAYNYIDMDVDITHDNDSQGSHGSHVAGIAAANRYIKRGSNYVSAIEAAGLQGNAPDAQIIVMKVFGKMGGAYDSDYMAAIEDAIILGCDAVNLSLGSSNAGFTTSEVYQTMLDDLSKTDTVVAIAAGNEGNWATYSGGPVPNLYIEDVNLQTVGSPGSYTNALTVASVNNDGTVGPSLKVGDRSFGYFDGDGYYNEPMASLDTSGSGTEYDYVFLDGIGVASDYTGIDVTGKVVFVSRGETNFADKAKVAFQQGAIATVIYNNELEGITMDLSGYWEEPPCVIISMAQGNYVRENSTPATTEDGVTYYTGKVTVQGSASANVENSEYYTMSPFSSWGVPGDLSLKPEITAPGGNIYSVKGDVAETDQYELSSGTSMATPQVAGMVALIQQAIGERGLAQEGMTNRALAQSLLMSTAVPLKDGESRYYSILQQGAGLANVLAATSAKSFVTVDGQTDGKVKAELGDDPQRSGVYSFSFRLNNLGEAETVFALSADLFTQDAFVYYANNAALAAGDDSKLAAYLDTATLDLGFSAAWETTGELVSTTEPVANCDFDGDGDVDTDDGQALLDYVTGLRESVSAAEYADVSGDGLVDTYDVHVFLAKLQGSAVAVPAGESVQVTVTLTLSDEAKDYLDTYYTKGAYIQAFVYADAVTDAEGVDGTCHSIPMLAFYGSWTESSMYENGTVQTYATGEELHDPYTGSDAVNTLSVEYARDPGYTYYLGGNPLVADRTYHPERNAFNNTNGDKIYKLQINTIRNAVDSRLTVTNTATGEVLRQEHSGAINAPYYTVVFFMEMWVDGIYSYRLQWAPKNVNEGDTLEFTVDTAPEYYLDEEGNVDWDALGEGATFTVPLTMDSTAPVISGVSVDVINNTLEVEASDNQYVAAVALFNGSGKEVLTYTGSKEDTVPGETYSYEMDLSKANGNKFLVQVYDYAYNVTTYELRMELGEVPPLPELIAFDREYNYYWTAFTVDSWYRDLSIYCESDVVFNAATIDSHYIFACTDTGDLYVMPETDLSDRVRVRNLGVVLNDMAYSEKDDKIYGVAYNEAGESVLYTVDKMMGDLTEVGVIGLNTNTLACDPSGTFYCNEFGTSKVYSFTLDTMAEPSYMLEVVNDYEETFTTMGLQGMEYDPNTRNVVWTSYYYEERSWGNWDYSFLYEIHPETNTYTRHNDMSHQLVALIIPEKTDGGDWTAPTDEIATLELSHETLNLLRDNTERLAVTILPWNVSDRTVTWTSADPSIAEVDQYGLVTAHKVGTTTITVRSNLDPTFSDSVTVTVEAVPVDMEGILLDEEGKSMLFSWDVVRSNTWTAGIGVDVEAMAATDNGKGSLIVTDSGAKTLLSVDNATGVSTTLGTWGTQMYSIAYSNLFSDETTDRVHMISGSFWLPAKDPADPTDDEAWEMFDYLVDADYAFEFVAIATGGTCTVEDAGQTHEAEEIFLIDDNGNVWKLHAYADGDFYNSTEPEFYYSNLQDIGYEFTRMQSTMLPLCSLAVGEDGNLYFSGYNGTTNVFYQLVFNETTRRYDAVAFGNSGADVWPAILTDVNSNAAAAGNSTVHTGSKTLADTARRVHAGEKNRMPLSLLNTESAAEITVELEKDLLTTNGLITVSYDAAMLQLKGVESTAQLTARREGSGYVTFGYAGVNAIPAGTAAATLLFEPLASGETEVTVTVSQRNDAHPEETETIYLTLEKPCGHENSEVRNAANATCTQEGYTGDTYCTDCGALIAQGEVIPAAGHVEELRNAVEPTETEDGYTGDTYCAVCDTLLKTGEVIPATGHTHSTELRDAKEATCTEDGYTGDLVCTLCGAVVERGEVIPAHCPSAAFADVGLEQWYHEYVDYVVENGLMKGMSDSSFAPNGNLTRAMMVTTLYRLAGSPEVELTDKFTDVSDSQWYAKAVAWAAENGIVYGITDTTFCPNQNVTREQAATILYRYVTEYLEVEVETGAELNYTDADQISDYAKDAVAWATADGLFAGFPDGTVQPRGTLTRAQMAKLLTVLSEKF